MSKRPTHAKKMGRLRKALRSTPTRYINLVDWLQAQGHANTAGGARDILIAGRVRHGSHPVGRSEIKYTINDEEHVDFFAAPAVPAEWRDDLVVLGELAG